jgi:diaminohydroxyphosphoribosylaminopyrimidine deaminase / 5-amino-6-(5-phosphoribosylamino)uracil reductase
MTVYKYHDTMVTTSEDPQQRDIHEATNIVNPDRWAEVPRLLRESENLLPPPWQSLFGPLRRGLVDDLVVIGQCGQSIDARIATASGHSHYINGEAGLAHLHRLRALVDAVVVGVGTAQADDPQLTVRRVTGPNPARVVIDPSGRLTPNARMLANDGIRRLVIARPDAALNLPAEVEVARLAASEGQIAPAAVLQLLAQHGFRRILIEGGSNTVSRFLAAGCLDRLHVVIAPIIIGAGPSSVSLAPIARVEQAIKAPMQVHVLGDEVLLDCDLSAQRIRVGIAKQST